MMNHKEITRKKVAVVKKVSIPATLREIPHGASVRFSRRELGGEGCVRAAIWRENAKHVDPEFSLMLVDNGMYYDITRR